MKSLKRALSYALVVLMILSLSACGKKPEDQLIGKWNFDTKSFFTALGAEEADIEEFMAEMGEVFGTVEFTKDGRVITSMTSMGESTVDENTYTVEDNKIIIDGKPSEFKIEKNTLTITDETGTSLQFVKD